MSLTVANVLTATPEEIESVLVKYFNQDIPVHLDAKHSDWAFNQQKLLFYSNSLAFLYGLRAVLKRRSRMVKKEPVELVHVMGKRDIVEDAIEATKAKYDGLSRAFTIYQDQKTRDSGKLG